MDDHSVKIQNPQEVREKIVGEAPLLERYSEEIRTDSLELSQLEYLVSDAAQAVNRQLQRASEEESEIRSCEDSPGKQQALQACRAKTQALEEQARIVVQCRDGLLELESQMRSVYDTSRRLFDEASRVAATARRYLDRIIDAM